MQIKISGSFGHSLFREIRAHSYSTRGRLYREKGLRIDSCVERVRIDRDHIKFDKKKKTKTNKRKRNKRLLEAQSPFGAKRITLLSVGKLLLGKVEVLRYCGNLGTLKSSRMPQATKKRKFSDEGEGTDKGGSQKYYAVRKGRKTGVFTNWKDCEEQIMGFAGSMRECFLFHFLRSLDMVLWISFYVLDCSSC